MVRRPGVDLGFPSASVRHGGLLSLSVPQFPYLTATLGGCSEEEMRQCV